jgi:hypothetical protein
VLNYTAELVHLGLASDDDIREAFAASMETEAVPRRFLPRRWLAERLGSIEHREEGQEAEHISIKPIGGE